MEFLIGYILIAVIMLCMGFKLVQIGMFTLVLMGVLVVLIGVFFAVCLVFIAMSRRKTAVFTAFDENHRFSVAVYRIDGEEVPNMFPSEMIMRNKLYVPEKEIRLLYCKPRRAAIDGNALVTMIAGSAVFIPAAVFSAIAITAYIKGFFM
ncbi:MAG: hypothetical protein K2J80_10165 [Oscillospiraceae bacterium]|nr:hypothetical protein [Oscillospiraceae bacterium]